MISIRAVTKQFRKTTVLNHIDLEIKPGDRIALVGSNGAGKTTLIRCLLGEYNFQGRIEINGLEPAKHRTSVLKRMGFVPQLSPPLKMPVGQLINFAAGVCGSKPESMLEICHLLGLESSQIWRRPFNKLSGGQKQKLLISIALGRDTELLVLDEPAANLDPEARHTFFQLLAEKQQHAAMLISSHRLDEVAALVNRVVELDQGNVVLDDHVADQIDLSSVLACCLTLNRVDSAFAETIREWGFASDDGLVWRGEVAGPDRLRFLGVLSRYAALLNGIQLVENGKESDDHVQAHIV